MTGWFIEAVGIVLLAAIVAAPTALATRIVGSRMVVWSRTAAIVVFGAVVPAAIAGLTLMHAPTEASGVGARESAGEIVVVAIFVVQFCALVSFGVSAWLARIRRS